MNPEQFIALLLVIADQRITIEALRQQLAELQQKETANGQKIAANVPR